MGGSRGRRTKRILFRISIFSNGGNRNTRSYAFVGYFHADFRQFCFCVFNAISRVQLFPFQVFQSFPMVNNFPAQGFEFPLDFLLSFGARIDLVECIHHRTTATTRELAKVIVN